MLTSKHNARVVKRMNDKGFVVNLSANNVKHADALYDLGIAPVATVLPETQTTNTTTPKGRKVVVCPATIRDDVSCATCQLCAKQRDAIITTFSELSFTGSPGTRTRMFRDLIEPEF